MIDNIEKLGQELAQVFFRIEERRNLWHTTTCGFIKEQLDALTVRFPMFDWKTQVNEVWQNMESVYVVFNAVPSGIVEKTPVAVTQKMKKGGLLSFSQSRNGQVTIWIAYPAIDGLTEEEFKNVNVETLEPEEIDEACMKRSIEKFLEEMIQWENDGRNEIGFLGRHHLATRK